MSLILIWVRMTYLDQTTNRHAMGHSRYSGNEVPCDIISCVWIHTSLPETGISLKDLTEGSTP